MTVTSHNAHDPGSVLHRSGAAALCAKAKLNELNAALNDAVSTYALARDRASRPWQAAEDVSFELATYYHAVAFKQRDPDPDKAYRLTVDFLEGVESSGLVVELLDPKRPALGFRLVDPTLASAVEATGASARAAAATRDAYARENAALIREHTERENLKRVRDALEGDDPDAFRDALRDVAGPARDTHTNSLTTHGMAGIR